MENLGCEDLVFPKVMQVKQKGHDFGEMPFLSTSSSNLGQGTCLGCGLVPSQGATRGNRSVFFSLSFFFPFPLFKNK